MLARNAKNESNPLTHREIEVLRVAATGLPIKKMAHVLGISPGTVTWHLKNSYQKLDAGSRMVALKRARQAKFLGHIASCPVCACDLSNLLRPDLSERQ